MFPPATGRIMVGFFIAKDGRAAEAKVESKTLEQPQLESCVLTVS